MASFSTIMLSIHPVYSEKIFQQEKKIEFRKRIIPNNVKRILVYSTAPDRKIVGFFEVRKIVHESPYWLWNEYSESGGIEKEKFFSYFSNNDLGYGILIGKTYRFSNPVMISSLKFKAPQFFRYVGESEFSDICSMGIALLN